MTIDIGDSTATVRSKINAVLTDAGLNPADNVDTTAATTLLNQAAVVAGVAVTFYDRQPEAEFRERFALLNASFGPLITSPPTVSGTQSVGSVLSATTGGWTSPGTISYAYQWWRGEEVVTGGEPVSYNGGTVYVDKESIPGATASTFTLTNFEAGLLVWVEVTASDANGSNVSPSEAKGPAMAGVVARFTNAPTTTRAQAVNTFVRSCAAIIPSLDALYVMAAADEQAARRNWIADAFNLTAVSSPTFILDRGFQGDGVNAYLTTGFTPSTAPTPKYTQDVAAFGLWSLTAAASAGNSDLDMGTSNVLLPRAGIRIRVPTNTSGVTINDNTLGGPTTMDGSGFFAVVRTGATARQLRRNKASILTDAAPSTGLPSNVFAVLAGGTQASRSARLISIAFIGGLSPAQCDTLYDAAYEYLLSLGAV